MQGGFTLWNSTGEVNQNCINSYPLLSFLSFLFFSFLSSLFQRWESRTPASFFSPLICFDSQNISRRSTVALHHGPLHVPPHHHSSLHSQLQIRQVFILSIIICLFPLFFSFFLFSFFYFLCYFTLFANSTFYSWQLDNVLGLRYISPSLYPSSLSLSLLFLLLSFLLLFFLLSPYSLLSSAAFRGMEHQPTVVHKRCRPSLTSATPPSTPSSPCSMYALLFLSFLFSSSFLLFFLSFLFIILLFVLLSFFILPRRYSNEYATGYKGWDVGRQLHSGTLCLFSSSLWLTFLIYLFFSSSFSFSMLLHLLTLHQHCQCLDNGPVLAWVNITIDDTSPVQAFYRWLYPLPSLLSLPLRSPLPSSSSPSLPLISIFNFDSS